MTNMFQKTLLLVFSLLCATSAFRTKQCIPPLVRCAHDARLCCVVQQDTPTVVGPTVVGVRHFVQQFQNGEDVEYLSSQSGWIPAKILSFYPLTGHYDLNIRNDIPWEKLRKRQVGGNTHHIGRFMQQFENGVDVEYRSSQGWIAAKVTNFHTSTGNYDLNIRSNIPVEKLRRPVVHTPPQKPIKVIETKPQHPIKVTETKPHNPIEVIETKPQAAGEDERYCQYYKAANCGSVSDFNNGKGSIPVWQNCPKLCAEYIEENDFEPPETELRVVDCIKGGYTNVNPPKHTWNPASGEYWETCVSDIDISDAKRVFFQNPAENWYEAAMLVLSKVYPVGAMMWQFQKEQYETHNRKMIYFDGVMKFLKISDLKQDVYWVSEQQDAIRSGRANPSFAHLIQINTPVHENCHRHHSTLRGFRPLNTWDPFFETPSVPNTWDNVTQFPLIDDINFIKEFPRRWEIYNDIPEWTRDVGITDTYFPDHNEKGHVKEQCGDSEAGPNGCARIAGLLSEAECYIHGVAASLWTSSLGRSFTPFSEVNTAMEGAVFPVAYWQHVHVLYLQHMKKNAEYSVVWSRLTGNHPEMNLPNIAKIFLAHYDRCRYILSMSNWLGNHLQERTLQMMKLTKKKIADNDVISDLRAQFR